MHDRKNRDKNKLRVKFKVKSKILWKWPSSQRDIIDFLRLLTASKYLPTVN